MLDDKQLAAAIAALTPADLDALPLSPVHISGLRLALMVGRTLFGADKLAEIVESALGQLNPDEVAALRVLLSRRAARGMVN